VSTTRLVILGAVRIFQPVHGYFVRRELMTWRADEWAPLNPGSVYNALRTLARDDFLEETGTEASDGRPARTLYRLTDDGETEFLMLLRDALWQLHPDDPSRLMAGVSFMWALSREEVRAALEHRVAQIEAAHRGLGFSVGDLLSNPRKPRHVAEVLRLVDARMGGEAVWAHEMLARLEAGEYAFAGEPLDQSNLTKPL
jgi:DNA-binding PadR family transcriptional regulator